MKNLILFLCSLISFQHLFAQNTPEKAYTTVVNEGPTTAPGLVVITIINLNTGGLKEMCLTVNELFDCLELELHEDDSKKIKKYLLSKSSDRTISLKNQEALKLINFEKYKAELESKQQNKINYLITKNHLIDSLAKIDTIERKKAEIFNDYEILRRTILKKIADSISAVRPLNKKEKTMLLLLIDPYYDEREEQCEKLPWDSKADSISRMEILEIWDSKKSLYKNDSDKCASVYQESDRCEKKFFRTYYKKYGLVFCQVLFKYGVICYFGDENPIVEFGGVIK